MEKDRGQAERFAGNQELSRIETAQRKLVLDSCPSVITAIITNRCNLRCIMCPRIRGPETTLDLAVLKKIYPLLPYVKWIDWQGGEVFLVDYFKEVFLKVAGFGHIEQHIATNGMLIDEEWAQIFGRSRTSLIYSIDGVSRDIYEFVRRGARFDRLLESLELVNKYRKSSSGKNRLELSVVVMKCNYRSLELFVDFCARYDFQHLNLNLLLPGTADEQDIIFNPDREALDYLREAIPRIKEDCRKRNIEVDCYFESFLHKQEAGGQENKQALLPDCCIHPWTRLHIESDGAVRPACQCSADIGNLNIQEPQEIWNGPQMQRYRQLLSQGRAKEICSFQCSCAGGREGQIKNVV